MNGDGDHMSPTKAEMLVNESELNNSVKEANSSVKGANPRDKSVKTTIQEPKKKQSPWTTLFQNNRDLSLGLELEQYGFEEVVELSQQEVNDTKAIWKGTLIGYVVGKPTGPKDIEALRQQWKISFQYMKHPSGWTIFRFDTDEQKQEILANGPYSSSGFPWIVKDVPPFFSFGDESFNFIPVWVTLPGLPMECWNKRVLSRITSQVGKPITTDKCTRYNLRVSFARVLVEIDATKSLVRTVKIKMPDGNVLEQQVLYEFEPKLCSICNRVGHSTENCRSVKKPREKNPTKPNAASYKASVGTQQAVARPVLFRTVSSTENNVEGSKNPAGSTNFSKDEKGSKNPAGSTKFSTGNFGPSPSEAYAKTHAEAKLISTKGRNSTKGPTILPSGETNLAKASAGQLKNLTEATSNLTKASNEPNSNAANLVPASGENAIVMQRGPTILASGEPNSNAVNKQSGDQKLKNVTEEKGQNQFHALSVVDGILEDIQRAPDDPHIGTTQGNRKDLSSEPSTSHKAKKKGKR